MVVPVSTGDTFQRGTPRRLFAVPQYYEGPMYSWDISPDGQKFLMVKRVEAAGDVPLADDMIVIQNLDQELLERVPLD